MGKILKVDINLNNNSPTDEATRNFIIILVFACHFQHNKIISLQTATRGQYDPSLGFFSITYLVYLAMTPTFVTLSRQVSSRST